MSDPTTCPHCGSPLSTDAPGGLCPACLLRICLDGDTNETEEGPQDRCGKEGNSDIPVATSEADGPSTLAEPMTQSGKRSGGGASDLASIRYLGDYELLDEISRGGMGVVYRRGRRASIVRLR